MTTKSQTNSEQGITPHTYVNNYFYLFSCLPHYVWHRGAEMKWMLLLTMLLGIMVVVTFPRKKQVTLMGGSANGTGNVGKSKPIRKTKVEEITVETVK